MEFIYIKRGIVYQIRSLKCLLHPATAVAGVIVLTSSAFVCVLPLFRPNGHVHVHADLKFGI